MTDFEISLKRATERLNRQKWFEPLRDLQQRFEGIPFDDIEFKHELLDMLAGAINTLEVDDQIPIDALVAIRLSKLTAWSIRAQYKTKDGHATWNPLSESFTDFQANAPETGLKVFQSAHAYPADDIIKRWARDNLF